VYVRQASSRSSDDNVVGWAGDACGDNQSARASLLNLDLTKLAPVGHYLAIRVGFAFPLEEVNALPQTWIDFYTSQAFLLSDPVVRWAHTHEGVSRWSDFKGRDPAGVIAAARNHGIHFGAAASLLEKEAGRQRSFGIFLRSDREFLDHELQELWRYLQARHNVFSAPKSLTVAEIEALRRVKEGQRIKQIAFDLGVGEGAIKQRLRAARLKLEARTGAEAISRAVAFGII
jgi:LuxR family transcriptional regulator